MEAVGICASDLKCYHGAAKFWGDENRPAWAETEVIPGHEFVGTVVQLDDAAAEHWGIAVGDRVVGEQIVPCWKCRYCLDGKYWMCAPARHVRLQAAYPRRHGGVHGLLRGRARAQGLRRPAPGARRLRRAAVLRAARGRARRRSSSTMSWSSPAAARSGSA